MSSRNYDAFGAVTSSSGTHQGPFGYGGVYGYQTDPDTALMLLGHRYYDSSTGRFVTRDPIKDGRNWYGYGGGFANPVNSVDPDGLMPFRADVVPTDEGLAWNGRSAPYGCPWLDGLAGFGDGVSGGLSRIVRGWLGAGDVVNTDSGAYGWGEIGGTAYSYLLPGPKGLKVPGKRVGVPPIATGSYAKSMLPPIGKGAYAKLDKCHQIPILVVEEVYAHGTKVIVEEGKYIVYRMPGFRNGKKGTYEVGVATRDGVEEVAHVFFKQHK